MPRKTTQYNTRQDNTQQCKTIQYNTIQDNLTQAETIQDITRTYDPIYDKAIQDNIIQ